MHHLLALGFGYSARRLAGVLQEDSDPHWRITGTRATGVGGIPKNDSGAMVIEGVTFGTGSLADPVADAISSATHLLVSVPPDAEGDPVLRSVSAYIGPGALQWVGYLSTTGVYGDHGGSWVDETTPPAPASPRTQRRVDAEEGWSSLCAALGVPLQIYRLSGIYGPGRSVVDRLLEGSARRIVKKGHVFNRVHVDDLARAVASGVRRPDRSGVFNLADDLPSSAEEPVLYAAGLMDVDPPPPIQYEKADLGPMGRSFYESSRRVRNDRAKRELGWSLAFPTYREGIRSIVEGLGR